MAKIFPGAARLHLAAILLLVARPPLDAQIQLNGGGPATPAPRPAIPSSSVIPQAPPSPNAAPGLPTGLTVEEARLSEAFQELGRREGLTRSSIPKLIEIARQQYDAALRAHGEGHPLVVKIAKLLVRLHHMDMVGGHEGEAEWAREAYRHVKLLREKVPSVHESVLAGALGDLITPLCNLDRLDEAAASVREAIPLFEDEVGIRRSLAGLGPPSNDSLHVSIANGLLGLGEYHRKTGDLAAAETWLKRAVAFAREYNMQGDYLPAVRALASVYDEIRDYSRSEPLRLEALRVSQAGFGSPDAPECAPEYILLGWNFTKQGRFSEAEPLIRRGLAMLQRLPRRDVILESRTASALGEVLRHVGKSAEAAQLYREAIVSCGQTGPPGDMAVLHINEALFLSSQNRFPEAIAGFRTAIGLLEKAANPAYDDYQDRALFHLAWAERASGHADEAGRIVRRWADRFRSRLGRVLAFTDEDQRSAWMSWQRPCDLPAQLGLADLTMEMLLRTKGIVLDSMIEDRALAREPAAGGARAHWEEWQRVRRELQQAQASPGRLDVKLLAKLEARESELQSALAREGSRAGQVRRSATISPTDIRKAVPKGSVLLDYFAYHRVEPGAKVPVACYGVIIQTPDAAPKLHTITRPAEEIDEMISLFNGTMHRPPSQSRDKDEALAQVLKYLHATLVAPLEKEFPDAKTLIVSADGMLNLLPYACLMDPAGHFVCERYTLRQISSARDLAAPAREEKPGADKTIAAFDGANYLRRTENPAAASGGWLAYAEAMIQGQHTEIRPLPGTERELSLIAARAKSAGWKIDLHTGDDASEASLRNIKSPAVLHIATHGYFVSGRVDPTAANALSLVSIDGRPERLRSLFDPMRRGGLFLSGAENTFRLRKEKKTSPAENDGILNASEAATLDLTGTWLVTLSACDSGAGSLVSGEGVIGLRRAFQHAGARNIMMTLWPIYDGEAAAFIDEFYTAALGSGDAAAALSATERAWLVRENARRGLWESIKRAGAFILVGTGR